MADINATDVFLGIVRSCVAGLPLWIAWIVGVVLAIVRWQRHPRVSMLTVVALGILAVLAVIGSVVSIYLPATIYAQTRDADQVGVALLALGFVESLVSAIAWALLLVAIFGSRGQESRSVIEERPGNYLDRQLPQQGRE